MDPKARVDCETLVMQGTVIVTGQITTSCYVNIPSIVRKTSEEKITELVKKHFDMRPKSIINHLKLIRLIYWKTAVYGCFGRNDPDFTWEKTDKAEILKKEVSI